MIEIEAEKKIDIPIDEVWEWIKNPENIDSALPIVEIIDKTEEGRILRTTLLDGSLSMPEEITTGKSRQVEVDEAEKYAKSVIEGEIWTVEASTKCEEISENETKIYFKGRGGFKGLAGSLLEKMLFFTPFSNIALEGQIEEVMDEFARKIRKHMRERWRKALEEKTKELEAFVYTVSHDLRTPLISIEGFSDMLLEEYEDELDEDAIHYLNRIQSNVEKMDEFIDDLLQLSRIGREETPKEVFSVESIVEEITEDLSSKVDEKDIKIKIETDLPELYFERKRMYQIFSNFVSNACKYMDDEQEECWIKIGAEDRGNSWVLWVEDNGIGIEPENQEKIFKIFNREGRADEKGTGVGLSIVKQIVESHKGEIWVESEKGEGSTFYIEFPKAEVENEQN